MKISAVLLAAGNSVRFEKNKLLSPLNGKELALYTFDAVKACSRLQQVAVVTQYEEIAAFAQDYGYDCVKNSCPERGISYSLQLGLAHCLEGSESPAPDAVIFAVCDQPFLTARTLNAMAAAADHRHILRCSSSSGKGNPALFPSAYYEELMRLHGDTGGRVLMEKYAFSVREIPVQDTRELLDIDTPLQWIQMEKQLHKQLLSAEGFSHKLKISP